MSNIERLPLPILNAIAPIARLIPKPILALRYRRWAGKPLNWKQPSNLQEYIFKTLADAITQPSKLEMLSVMADKIAVRDYVNKKAPSLKCPTLFGTWDKIESIDWTTLPDKFVMKTNNGCATNIIVRKKDNLDINEAATKLSRWLKFPYGALSGQLQYDGIPPMILAEELLEVPGAANALPVDYKIFCFHGKAEFILYYEDRSENGHLTPNMAFDLEWNPLPGIVNWPINHDVCAPLPLKEMIHYAEKLSKDIDFARIDFYEINKQPVFGEITLTPDVITNFTNDFLVSSMKFTLPHRI